jgi:hypothetical protein
MMFESSPRSARREDDGGGLGGGLHLDADAREHLGECGADWHCRRAGDHW